MERYEVDADARLTPMLNAVERGDEVVILRDGQVVAEVRAKRQNKGLSEGPPPFSPEGLKRLKKIRALVRGSGVTDAAALVREMREADDH